MDHRDSCAQVSTDTVGFRSKKSLSVSLVSVCKYSKIHRDLFQFIHFFHLFYSIHTHIYCTNNAIIMMTRLNDDDDGQVRVRGRNEILENLNHFKVHQIDDLDDDDGNKISKKKLINFNEHSTHTTSMLTNFFCPYHSAIQFFFFFFSII